MVVDAATGEFLDLNAPVQKVSVSRTLNGPGDITVTLPLEYNARRDANGHPWLLEGGTLLVAEAASGELYCALVGDNGITLGEKTVEVSAGGASMLATGTPWDGDTREWISMDALHGWRHIWQHLRAQPGALYVDVWGDTECGVRVGRPESEGHRWRRLIIEEQDAVIAHAERGIAEMERLMKAALVSMYAAAPLKQVGEVTVSTSAGSGDGSPYAAHIRTDTHNNVVSVQFWVQLSGTHQWATMSPNTKARAQVYLDRRQQKESAEERKRAAQAIKGPLEQALRDQFPNSSADPYRLNWWSTHDLSANLDELRDLGGFDWWESARWDGDRIKPVLNVKVAAGTIRDDLRLELGVNVHALPDLHRGMVRTEVQVFGEGEGSAILHAERTLRHPRLVRWPLVVEDKTASTQQLVDRAADRALGNARAALQYSITDLTVVDHPHAPPGSYNLGDVLPLIGVLPDGSRLNTMVRVMEITDEGTGTLTLKVDPA